MKRIRLPMPPNPNDSGYATSPMAYQRAVHDWMMRTKEALETASAVNDVPAAQPLVSTSFTTNTMITGTSTGTDIANFVCSLVAVLTQRGIITPNTSGGVV